MKNKEYLDKILNVAKEYNIDIKTAFELGSRDIIDGSNICKRTGAQVHIFECNPIAIDIIKRNYENLDDYLMSKIFLNFHAVNTFDGECDFYPIVYGTGGDIGGASILKFDDKSQLKFEQTQLKVPCKRLDTYCDEKGIKNVDFIWSDLQGFDITGIMTLGRYLKTVELIFCEIEYKTVYNGSLLFNESKKILENEGFKLVYNDYSKFLDHYGNCIFVRTNHE